MSRPEPADRARQQRSHGDPRARGQGAPTRSTPSVAARPLVVATDADLVDHLVRLAAAVGHEVDLVDPGQGPGPTVSAWSAAPVVLVGLGAAAEVAALGLPPRGDVAVVASRVGEAPLGDRAFREAVALGATHVLVLPEAEDALVDLVADRCDPRVPAPLVVVTGGRGGAGATTLAVALAVTAVRRQLRAVLVDADPLGGGIDLAMGAESVAGLRWPDLASTRGRVAPDALETALPVVAGLPVLSWDRGDLTDVSVEAMGSLVAAARRWADLVVADVPRVVSEPVADIVRRAQTVLLVVPAEVRAAAAAVRVAASARSLSGDVRLVVRGPAPAGLPAHVVAESLDLPLVGYLRPEPGLAAAFERGEAPATRGRGPLAEMCRLILDDLLAGSRAA